MLVRLLLTAGLALFATSAVADDMATCIKRQAELTKQAASFKGSTREKRLIDADLKRADSERAEGDGDECIEALDHAAKLLHVK